jgi:DNA-binding FrmR family transcriptional regulator
MQGRGEAIERALEDECRCAELLQLIPSSPGAMNGLLAIVLAHHVHINNDAAFLAGEIVVFLFWSSPPDVDEVRPV